MTKPSKTENAAVAQRRRELLRDSALWVGSALAITELVACAEASQEESEDRSGSGAGVASDSAALRLACPVVTGFPAVSDFGPRSTFTRMDRGDALEWIVTSAGALLYAAQLPDTILFMLRCLDGMNLGYPISMLSHSLQAAMRARNANASDDLVLAALCHHLGTLITVEGQAELSASILRGFISEDAYRVVRHHTEYQWGSYGSRVGLPTTQRERYAAESWHRDALRFCDEWDSPAYDPSFATLPLAEFEPLLRAKLGPESGYLVGQLTSGDCV